MSKTLPQVIASVKNANIVLQTPVPLSGSEWADQHFYLSPESSGMEGKWKSFPYQIAILNWMADDDIKILSMMKAARTGYSKMLLSDMCLNLTHRKRNIAAWFPNDGDRDDFSKDEFKPLLRDIPEIRKAIAGNPDRKGDHNTLSKKVFYGATLDLKGGKAAANYRAMTKDRVYYDELSGFDPVIENEGDAISIGDVRIVTSAYPKSVRGSTPKLKGLCQMEKSLADADKTFYRFVPCPHCGEYQRLEWSRIKCDNDDHETTVYICEKNGCIIEYSDYSGMDKKGEWRTLNGEWYEEKTQLFYNLNNKRIDPPRHIGIALPGMYSYFQTWRDGMYGRIKAKEKEANGDISQIMAWTNTYLGEPYEMEGIQASPEILEKRAKKYAYVPKWANMLTCGVDVQKDRLEYLLVAWGPGEECCCYEFRKLMGDPDKSEVWAELDEVIKREYYHESGGRIKICAAFVDAKDRPQRVYNYTRTRGPVVSASMGRSNYGHPVITKPQMVDFDYSGEKIKNGVERWMLGVDTAKVILYKRLENIYPGESYIHFNKRLPPRFYTQLTSEKLVIEYKNGVAKYLWVQTRKRNEALDCFNYAYAAAIRAGLQTLTAAKWQQLADYVANYVVEKDKPALVEQVAVKRKRKKQKVKMW